MSDTEIIRISISANINKDDHEDDCDYCARFDTCYCDDCENNEERITENYWLAASPEMVAERKAKEQKRLEDSVISTHMDIKPSDTFMNAFKLAKKFTSKYRPSYCCVLATENAFVATDNYRLVEIACPDIPAELQGKRIVRIDDQVAITEKAFPDYQKVVFAEHFIDNPDIAAMTTAEEPGQPRLGTDETVMLHVPGADILLNSRYIKEAQEILGTVSRLGYTDDHSGVILYSDVGCVVTLPMKKRS